MMIVGVSDSAAGDATFLFTVESACQMMHSYTTVVRSPEFLQFYQMKKNQTDCLLSLGFLYNTVMYCMKYTHSTQFLFEKFYVSFLLVQLS